MSLATWEGLLRGSFVNAWNKIPRIARAPVILIYAYHNIFFNDLMINALLH